MENLTLDDNVPSQQVPLGGGAQMHTQGQGQNQNQNQHQKLPPQMFTTAAQLLDMTDKKLVVALRDGRKLIGVLRSWDQFANLVLQQTIERIYAPPTPTNPGLYADVPRGIFLVRGENVLLLGEIDLDKDDEAPPGYELADVITVHRLQKERKEREREREKVVKKRLGELGFEGENAGEALL